MILLRTLNITQYCSDLHHRLLLVLSYEIPGVEWYGTSGFLLRWVVSKTVVGLMDPCLIVKWQPRAEFVLP